MSAQRPGGDRLQPIGRTLENPDPDHAVQIAERIWWVGHYHEDDPFQCHVYLLEHGDQSVLFDPGSRLTFAHTLRKIEEVIPFGHIRYFVCHHQDPDIAAAMPLIDELVTRKDAVLVTHWRAEALLKHYALKLPFWLVDQHGWRLDLGGRELRFVFTPYAHFPGAFCTFDFQTGVLLSSDLFGGFTEGFALVAEDERYFEALRPFHEHYMPSREILAHSLSRLEALPLKLIAPQHGSIIPERLIPYIIGKLKGLDCGLYLLAGGDTDIQRLSRLNQFLQDITKAMVLYRDFRDIANALLGVAQRLLPVSALEFYAQADEGLALHLAPETRYRGDLVAPPPAVAEVLGLDHQGWGRQAAHGYRFCEAPCGDDVGASPALLLPLFAPAEGLIKAVAIVHLTAAVPATEELAQVVAQMSPPLQVAVEREALYRFMDLQRQSFYERAIRDPLTGLFTRFYMQDAVQRMFHIHDRDEHAMVAVAVLDIDHFKSINDTYGHNQGDDVLRQVAAVVRENAREGDLPVRLGGEEFAVFVIGYSAPAIRDLAERIRALVEATVFGGPLAATRITVSAGVAARQQREPLRELLHRADLALYAAKNAGRNRVCAAD